MDQGLPTTQSPHAWRTAALAALLLGGGALALHGGALDRQIFAAVNAWGPAGAVAWSALSVAGLGSAALLFAGAAGPRRPQVLAAFIVAVIGGGLLVQLLKGGFAMGRPLALLGPEAVQVIGMELRSRSMPSGHAAMAFTAAALLLAGPLRAAALPWRVLALLAALAVALSRIAVGAHWPSDVAAGAALGWAVGLAINGTPKGQALVARMGDGLAGRVGAHLTAAALVATACGFWVAEREYPQAGWMHGVVALIGLAAALLWWRAHPGPGAR
ncbi:putative PAP2 superfamily protein [Rubrivivax sp. A210]|uniref:phosphatase PAP2 family protein n=1 Tax=Rubrivivax sp. A210 TaxID=2772301 RepID=UPI00191B8AAE|nr:phosphatase PAP2 family protein [Rubrivivax sp. A210]CAD5370597.1 putative PAP2 superfamily protein [Rubrivivax sp. A210]